MLAKGVDDIEGLIVISKRIPIKSGLESITLSEGERYCSIKTCR